jgi:hypothetical protein
MWVNSLLSDLLQALHPETVNPRRLDLNHTPLHQINYCRLGRYREFQQVIFWQSLN